MKQKIIGLVVRRLNKTQMYFMMHQGGWDVKMACGGAYVLLLLWNRIITTCAPGVTARDAFKA
ncbi:hypothetical protein [Fulvivirga aurantia]|uniref:hypothetical protein n=1 Tax=Fulvivirga aurantia TaxID=2529383 RepID=UPI0016260CDD|nr:hypothetical protein [Fulvivirga aurantia]